MTSSPGSSSASMGKKMIGLPPGTTETCSGADMNAARAADIRGHGFAQFGIALRGTVMRPALVERLLGRFDDMCAG